MTSRVRLLIVTTVAFSMLGCGREVAKKVAEFQDTFHAPAFSLDAALLPGHADALAFSPDGGLLAASSAGNNEVHIWSLTDKPKLIKVLKQDPDAPVKSWGSAVGTTDGLRFTKDGTRLVNAHRGGSGNHFRIIGIWSTTSWTPIADVAEENAGREIGAAQIAVSSDGKFVIRARDWGPTPDLGGPRNQYGPAYKQLEAFDTDTGQLPGRYRFLWT